MVDAAVKDEEKGKSEEELKKDEAALELLQDLDKIEKEQGTSDEENPEEDTETSEDDDQTGESESVEEESDSESPESQTGKGQSKRSKGHKRRVGRLVEQRNKERAANQELLDKFRTVEEENKLLKLKNKQLGEAEPALTAPDPNDPKYDLGEDDPDFKAAKQKFDQESFRRIAREEAVKASQTTSERQSRQDADRELKRKLNEHWDEADKLEMDDYDDKQSKVIEILGTDMFHNIVDFFEPAESSKMIYHLGTNEDVAEEVGELLESRGKGMVKGITKLGQILERINAKGIPKKTTPNPDVENKGSDPSPQEALQLKLDVLRKNAMKSGKMAPILEFKRKARERGIALV